MADEKNELAEVPEFEEKSTPRSSKDLWLFLIIIDVVCLCVFGFFLYKNLSAKLLAPQVPPLVAEAEVAEVIVTDNAPVQTVEVLKVEEVAVPVEEPVVVPQEAPKPEPKPEEKPVVEEKPAPVAPAVTEKKESVTVKVNPKSKYRQVTFRYFGEAKEVAVVSGFTMAKPRALTKKNGVWETTLAISPGTYKYLLVIDGKQQLDPYAEEKDGRSVVVIE